MFESKSCSNSIILTTSFLFNSSKERDRGGDRTFFSSVLFNGDAIRGEKDLGRSYCVRSL